MKKTLIFSLFLSIITFYGIQENSDYFKEKFGKIESSPDTFVKYAPPQKNNLGFSIKHKPNQEPTLICVKFEGRLYCKSPERAI